MKRLALVWLVCFGCGSSSGSTPDGAVAGDGGSRVDGGAALDGTVGADSGEDFDMQPSDFECVTRWTRVRNFRITNKLGHTAEAVALANANTGGVYPVGTLIQLVPFEAMIKRRAGFSAASNDWEFFSLRASSSGTTILARGTDNVLNQFGGNCLTCHKKAMPQWDFICETGHGCDPLPLTAAQITSLQNNDARCP